MIQFDSAKREKIHTRKIDIATYQGASDCLVVEGILHDQRLVDVYSTAGDTHPPGTIHHMVIRMAVKGPQLVIEDIEVEMPTIPHDACIDTLESLAPIKGLSITLGFTAKVKDLVGRTKGCSHLMALLKAMAPAAVQGNWNAMAREPVNPETYIPMALERVKNSCLVWRENGPLLKEWRAK